MDYVIDHRATDGYFISLLRRDDENQLEPTWHVQVSDGNDIAEEELPDQWQAWAHFRTVCTNAGIQMGYQAPTFEVDVTVSPSVEMSAAQYFHEYRAWLQALSPGSDEVNALRDRLMADPAFVRLAPEIASLAKSADGWIGAVIRTTCRRIEVHAKQEEEAESLRLAAELEEFGQF